MFVVNLFGITFTWTTLLMVSYPFSVNILTSRCRDAGVFIYRKLLLRLMYMHCTLFKICNTLNSETHLFLWHSERGWSTNKVHWVDVDLNRALANWPVGKFNPLPAFVNKILSTHRHIYLFTYCLWLLSSDEGELSLKLRQSPCGYKVQNICSLNLYKKSADIWSRLGK